MFETKEKMVKNEANLEPDKLGETLIEIFDELDIPLPWSGDFDEFMGNPDNCLVFE